MYAIHIYTRSPTIVITLMFYICKFLPAVDGGFFAFGLNKPDDDEANSL